ncbi:MAG: GIY-YIG nuclease family protein [Deltaproteobacteria bacterium]|nr:GIY-YIG nuclease family protein [Deltaproteobacteria bacterium]
MNYHVYMLWSASKQRYYIGHTSNMEQRLERHNRGHVPSTKHYRPWVIERTVVCSSKTSAVKIEQHLKKLKKPKAAIAWLLQPSGRVAQLVRAAGS